MCVCMCAYHCSVHCGTQFKAENSLQMCSEIYEHFLFTLCVVDQQICCILFQNTLSRLQAQRV